MKQPVAKTEWNTLMLIIGCIILWFATGMLWHTGAWFVSLMVLPILAAFHTSLQHETIHGHPTRWLWLNELLVGLPLAGVFPYRRYKDLHLKHHNDLNLTDPYEDPESYFWSLSHYAAMRPIMKSVFRVNNTLVGRLIIGPLLTIIGFGRTEFQHLKSGTPGVRVAWGLHLAGISVLLAIVSWLFAMPIWVYGLFVVYPALSLTSMRSYAEHQAAENVGGRTAIVEAHPFFGLLYLNNNLHIVHHAHPLVPWYDLPTLYRERREQFLAATGNTLFNGYGDIARRFAFRIKQPVDHPFLHRETTPAK